MEDSNEDCVDKFDEIFDAVLSKPESEFYSSPNREDESLKTSKASKKKRQLNAQKGTRQKKNRRETTKDRLLEWNNFYVNQKFGIWVQCTKCNKWRKVLEYEEDHEVPTDWCCSMSISGGKGCDAPEDEEINFSPAEFVPGSIVWAKIEGYPWWPGMVEDDPDSEEYYWMNDDGSIHYHITFLDEKVTHAWVPSPFVCSYLKSLRNRQLGSKTMQAKYSHLIEAAKKKADQAILMSIKERLQHFSFAHRYTGKWPLAADMEDTEDTMDITEMLMKEVEDVKSINSDSDYKSISSPESKKNKENVDLDNDDVTVVLDSKSDKKETNKKKSIKAGSRTAVKTIAKDNAVVTNTTQNEEIQATKLLKKFINKASDFITNTDSQMPRAISETLATPSKRNKTDKYSLDMNEPLNETETLNDSLRKHKTNKTLTISKSENCTTVKQSNQKIESQKNDVDSKEHKDENMPNKITEDMKITDNIKQNFNIKKTLKKVTHIKSPNKKFTPPMKENIKSSECKGENSKTMQKKMKTFNRNSIKDPDLNMNDRKNNMQSENIRSNSSTQMELSAKSECKGNDKMKEKETEELVNINTESKLNDLEEINPTIKEKESKSMEDTEKNENIKEKKGKKIKNTKKEIVDILEKNLISSPKITPVFNLETTDDCINNSGKDSDAHNSLEDSKCGVNKVVKNQTDTKEQNIMSATKHDDHPSEMIDKKKKELLVSKKVSHNLTSDTKNSENKMGKNRKDENNQTLKKSTKPLKITKQCNQKEKNVSKFSVKTSETEDKENKLMKSSKIIPKSIQIRKDLKKDYLEESDLIVLSDDEINDEKESQKENSKEYFSVSISEAMQQLDDEDSDPFEAE